MSKHCGSGFSYGSYSTFSLAQSACDSDWKCGGVYDDDCYNSGTFTLCRISEDLEASIVDSCVYKKTTGSYHFNSCGSGVLLKIIC